MQPISLKQPLLTVSTPIFNLHQVGVKAIQKLDFKVLQTWRTGCYSFSQKIIQAVCA